MGGSLARSFPRIDRTISTFFSTIIPETLRFAVLSICLLRKRYKRAASSYKCTLAINRKSSEFLYARREKPELVECRICLSEFEEAEEGREIVDCKHAFHKHCLEEWLRGHCKASCPLCRGLVVPEVVLAEYQTLRQDQEEGIEKELALILLKVLLLHSGSTCNGY